jgi:hypothetical protein
VNNSEGNCAPCCNLWTAIVPSAGISFLFDDLDAALQGGSSEKRVAMLRQVTDPLPETRSPLEISQRLAPVARALIDLSLNRARYSGARFPEDSLVALLRGLEASARNA